MTIGYYPTGALKFTHDEYAAHINRADDSSSSLRYLGVDVTVIQTDTTLYILYRERRLKYTGWCQNDFIAQG